MVWKKPGRMRIGILFNETFTFAPSNVRASLTDKSDLRSFGLFLPKNLSITRKRVQQQWFIYRKKIVFSSMSKPDHFPPSTNSRSHLIFVPFDFTRWCIEMFGIDVQLNNQTDNGFKIIWQYRTVFCFQRTNFFNCHWYEPN